MRDGVNGLQHFILPGKGECRFRLLGHIGNEPLQSQQLPSCIIQTHPLLPYLLFPPLFIRDAVIDLKALVIGQCFLHHHPHHFLLIGVNQIAPHHPPREKIGGGVARNFFDTAANKHHRPIGFIFALVNDPRQRVN